VLASAVQRKTNVGDFYIRTEDIRDEQILELLVETKLDRQIIDSLKGRNPTILLGSRGVGKSFLMRTAKQELHRDFDALRVFPIYVSFTKSSLVQTEAPLAFHNWMLARICSAIVRGLSKAGLLTVVPPSLKLLAGDESSIQVGRTSIERLAETYEASWKSPQQSIDSSLLPDVDSVKEAIEDICTALSINRFALFIDEAAHIFLPDQQRHFFTLYRDLRSAFFTCNAAIYPGVTSFGNTFQPVHDATCLTLDRDITDADYLRDMREMVTRQADSSTSHVIEKNGQNFAVLAFAATGNPRILLKTIARAPKLSSAEVNAVLRDYYRTDIWSEHSILAGRYQGHKALIEWGRTFMEAHVLPELKQKNDSYLSTDRKTTCFFWLHRDVPKAVEHSMRILAYTGLVTEHSQGIRATRSEVGTRYLVNLGCLFSLEGTAASTTAFQIGKNLTIKRMTEYGANHEAFASLAAVKASLDDYAASNEALKQQLQKLIAVLDLTEWQMNKLHQLSLNTVGDVLNASESDLQKAHYVGDKRSRQMRNAAEAAVFEYLSG
jgi:hypothetical protein